MRFPTIHLAGGNVTYINMFETVTVSNPAVFDAFGSALFNNEYVMIDLSAKVDVGALGMRYTGIALRKVMTIEGVWAACCAMGGRGGGESWASAWWRAGMNQFQDTPPSVLSQTIYHGTETELFINLTVYMYNPSPVSMVNIGPLNMTLLVNVADRASCCCLPVLTRVLVPVCRAAPCGWVTLPAWAT